MYKYDDLSISSQGEKYCVVFGEGLESMILPDEDGLVILFHELGALKKKLEQDNISFPKIRVIGNYKILHTKEIAIFYEGNLIFSKKYTDEKNSFFCACSIRDYIEKSIRKGLR